MRKVFFLLLAIAAIRLLPRPLRAEAKALGLLTLLCQYLTAATAPANTSKTVNTEQRVAALETRAGDLEQGKFANLQSGSVIGQLQRGIFTNVSGGATITMETQQGSGTLHCGALSNFTSGPQTTFLATLSQCGPQADYAGHDDFTGTAWGTGERDFVNKANSAGQAIKNSLVNHGFMAP